MDDQTLRAILGRLQDLERTAVRYRQGEITDDSPLSVALGGSDIPLENVKALQGQDLAPGDVVAALTWARDLLILGRVGDGVPVGGFSTYRNSAVSLANNAVIPFDTEEWDDTGWLDTTTNIGRFTPHLAGRYRFTARVRPSAATDLTSSQYIKIGLAKNGSVVKNGTVAWQITTAQQAVAVVDAIVEANGSTDYFEVQVAHPTGGNLPIGTGAATTYFQGERLN